MATENKVNTRTTRAFKGTLTSFLQFGVVIALQIFLAPLVLKYAGQETLGVFLIIMQIIGYLALLDLGFGVSANRFLPQAYGIEDNYKTFSEVFSTTRTFTIFSNTIISSFLFIFAFSITSIFKISENISSEVEYSILLLAIWNIIRTPLQVYGNALIAIQELATANYIAILGNVLRLVLSISFILLGYYLIGLILAGIISEFIILYTQKIAFNKKLKLSRLQWRITDKKLFHSMLSFGFQALLINIAVRLVFYTDSLVAGYLFGAAAVSIYYTTQMPAQIFQQIVMRIVDNASPAINELFARNDTQALVNSFLKLQKYTLILILPFIVTIIFLGEALITIWVGAKQFGGDSMLYALAIFAFVLTMAHVSNAYVMAKGKIKILSLIAFTEGIGNLLLSLLLGYYWGLPGIIWATVFANVPTSIYLQIKAFNILEVDLKTYYNVVLKPLLLPIIYLIFITIILLQLDVGSLIYLILITCIIFIPYLFFSFSSSLNMNERVIIKNMLIIKRR